MAFVPYIYRVGSGSGSYDEPQPEGQMANRKREHLQRKAENIQHLRGELATEQRRLLSAAIESLCDPINFEVDSEDTYSLPSETVAEIAANIEAAMGGII